MEFQDISDYIRAGKDAVDILKSAYSLLPKGQGREDLGKKIEEVEELLKRSDAKLAKELGFPLCQCEFPPQIMLWKKDRKKNVCPECDDVYPRDIEIDSGESRLSWARRGGR